MDEFDVIDSHSDNVKKKLVLASKGQRFLNLFIDYLTFSFGGGILLGIAMVATGNEDIFDNNMQMNLVGAIIGLVYYIVLESTTGRTMGKLLTKTRVVTLDGGKPSTGQILGRSFARFIPFEVFSFLGEEGIGWHDSLSKTRVISEWWTNNK